MTFTIVKVIFNSFQFKCIGNDLYNKNALEIILIKNALEMIFTVKIHHRKGFLL